MVFVFKPVLFDLLKTLAHVKKWQRQQRCREIEEVVVVGIVSEYIKNYIHKNPMQNAEVNGGSIGKVTACCQLT